MKHMFIAALLFASAASAATPSIRTLSRPFTVRATQQGGGFSVDLPIVGRVRGVTTTFFTALDITNNTPQSTDVEFFFTPADGSASRSGLLATLAGFDNLHFDDFLQALVSAGLMTPNQGDNTFGTLLLTFTNSSFHIGTEATAVARIYSLASPAGTYGLAYRARPIETNGAHSLSSVISNSGGLVSNIGIENLGVDDRGAVVTTPVTVRLSFFDPATGTTIGAQPTFTLGPGQVIQLNDVFRQSAFQLPATSNVLVLFVDQLSGSGQLRGYVVMKDAATNDGAFVFMQESKAATF
jgi:hypothetical protein